MCKGFQGWKDWYVIYREKRGSFAKSHVTALVDRYMAGLTWGAC
jgi:hypothetical protein